MAKTFQNNYQTTIKLLLKKIYSQFKRPLAIPKYLFGRLIKTPLKLHKNSKKKPRMLEIGPGSQRIDGFETVNIVAGDNVDYIADASGKLPFRDNTFSLVYASHVLEHTPWYNLQSTVTEWVRILQPGGTLEIWVPDGYKLAKFIADVEEGIERSEWLDGWRPFNPENSHFKWANARILYGARTDYPSWHHSIITPKYLESLLKNSGLSEISIMSEQSARGVKHGWINLGMRGRKL